MKLLLILALILTADVVQASLRGPVQAETHPCSSIHWWKPGGYSVTGEKRLIRCAFNHVGVSASKGLSVAGCESRFHPYATNGRYKGLFQHASTYWRDRLQRYGSSWLKGWIYSVRTQAFVTARMVRDVGWTPWSCS